MNKAYQEAGVNLQAGYDVVRKIAGHVSRTKRTEVLSEIGGFGSLFELPIDRYKRPVLVSGTDGVGTKLKLAFALGKHDTIGIDAVAMCVNDIVVQGAEPLFFLDYLAMGKVDPIVVEQIVKGVADGCQAANCSLVGGETAEMPGFYPEGEYDIAGFSVGVVEKDAIIDGKSICEGDAIIGLASSGLHSNGFSLIRKVLGKCGPDALTQTFESEKTLGEVLLTPTKIYVKAILQLTKVVNVKGLAHITGGGFYENIPRMLPPGLSATIDTQSFPRPVIFEWVEKNGEVSTHDMYNTFNNGIGMVAIVSKNEVEVALDVLRTVGEQCYRIGHVQKDERPVVLRGIKL